MEHQVDRARRVLMQADTRVSGQRRAEFDRLLQVLKRAVVAEEFDLTELIRRILEAICDCGFERSVFGFVTEEGGRVRGRLGAGTDSEEWVTGFDFPVAGFPLDDRMDDGTLLAQQFSAERFLLLSVVIERKLTGCLYADRRNSGIGLEQVRPLASRARDLIGTAIRKRVTRTA